MSFLPDAVRGQTDTLYLLGGPTLALLGPYFRLLVGLGRRLLRACGRPPLFRGACNRLLLEAAGRGICGLDRRGTVTFVNAMAAELLGWAPDELVGRSSHEIVHHTRADGSAYPREACPIEATLQDGAVHAVRHADDDLFWRRDGTSFPVDYISTPVRRRGRVVGAVLSFTDVTERREAEKHLREAALVLKNMPEGVMITDARGVVQTVNPAFTVNTGYRRGEILGRTSRMLRSSHHPGSFYRALFSTLRDRGRWQGEIWIRRKDGGIYPEWLSISGLRDERGKITNYVGIYSDVNTQQDVKRRLNRLAYYDVLTGLPNRQLFKDRLDLALAQARREGNLVAVLFLDLDRFKHINDSLGHSFGDRLLRAVAGRVETTVRESDTIARIGGDEFTAILPGLTSPLDAAGVARKILERFSLPLELEGHELYVTASIGISLYPEDGADQESLMRKADTAMYRAKETGRNTFRFYRADLGARSQKRLALESELNRALERDELYLVYQPQVEIRTGRLVGVEALARWRHPRLGQVPPSTFIPVAEETGLIDRIGEWALQSACRRAGDWILRSDERFRIAVNLSGHQLRRRSFAERVGAVLRETGIPASSLTLELTESVLMDNFADQRATLDDLVRMGVQIAIDDFGTGYSSLSYIKRFSIDKLKIDQSFVQDLHRNANDRALAAMIIAIARATKIGVIAEGVERQDQLDFLREEGCDEVQGFLFSRPVPPQEITRMLDEQARCGPRQRPSRSRSKPERAVLENRTV